MYIEAFVQLRRILETIEDQALPFTLTDWSVKEAKGWWPWRKECGTAFCVMGWAAQDPWFIERGLRLKRDDDGGHYLVFQDEDSWGAAAAFLGISTDEAEFLFDGENYGRFATPSEVAIRMRAFVNGKTANASGKVEETAEGRKQAWMEP